MTEQTFKKSHYKGQQYEIMSAALSGADILVIAPTGMGKVCYDSFCCVDVTTHHKASHPSPETLSERYFRLAPQSLCFQVPAVAAQHGLTIVVSPLLCKQSSSTVHSAWKLMTRVVARIALMRDQIHALQELNIAAAMLSSKTSREEQQAILDDMESGHPRNRLLYS